MTAIPPDEMARARAAVAEAVTRAEAGDFSGRDTILDSLASPVADVRLKAAYACERIGFPAAVAPLRAMATGDPASECRNQAIYALVGVGLPAGVPALIDALGDVDVERRQDARTALYRLLGEEALALTTDEDGGPEPDAEEPARLGAWWRARSDRFRADAVYAFGELASPGVLIEQLRRSRGSIPDAYLDALRDWTGQDFGQSSLRTALTRWERWWTAHREEYEPGRRYFFGRLVQ